MYIHKFLWSGRKVGAVGACPPSFIPHQSSGSGGNCSQVLQFFSQEKWFWITRFSGKPRVFKYSFFLLNFHLDVVHLPGLLSYGPTSHSTSKISTSSPGYSFQHLDELLLLLANLQQKLRVLLAHN